MLRVLALVVIGFVQGAAAEVFVTAYRCDGTTPLPYKDPNIPGMYSDIMVGTRLVLIVSSDTATEGGDPLDDLPPDWERPEDDPEGHLVEGWWGGLQCTWDDWERGKLAGRGLNPNGMIPSYEGSCLEAAGAMAYATFVDYLPSIKKIGFDLLADDGVFAGDWFVLDYHAEKAGSCEIGLFDYLVSFDEPIRILTFTHVPSRDFNGDTVVDFEDFALLAPHWRQAGNADPNGAATPDLDGDGLVTPSDIAAFSQYWLERTDCNDPPAEPVGPASIGGTKKF